MVKRFLGAVKYLEIRVSSLVISALRCLVEGVRYGSKRSETRRVSLLIKPMFRPCAKR